MRNNPNPMIATEAGVRAVKKFAPLAEKNKIDFALIGGIAMHFYGGPRLTKDVDVIASDILPVEAERRLGFGGVRYRVAVGKLQVPLDWIVRKDDARAFYEKALDQAYLLPNGLQIITAEWLVILKYIAGRFKDQQDAVFLLKKKGLVNRKLVRRLITNTLGPTGWAAFAAGLKRWYDLADGKITTEKEDYEADRL
ncbi:MAG: hypothetical protein ABR530_10305 [Pyrinomonadaceae bacterium]